MSLEANDRWDWRMDTGRSVFVLLQNETLIRDMGRRRRRSRGGRRRNGLQEGVWSYWFKMRFSLIYLFSWTHSSRLSACFLLYVLWPQCPLPPPPSFLCVFNASVSESANICVCVYMCVHASTFILLLPLPMFFCVCVCDLVLCKSLCVYFNNVYEYVYVRVFCHRYHCMCAPWVWYEVRAWASVEGWMVSFGIDLFLLCVCQTCCASIAHIRKATSPWLLLSTMPENSSDYAGCSGGWTRAVLSYFFFKQVYGYLHQPH